MTISYKAKFLVEFCLLPSPTPDQAEYISKEQNLLATLDASLDT